VLPSVIPDGDVDLRGGFAPELMEIGIENVFGSLWTRDGLSRRDRSLVTLGVFIALRAGDELKFHFKIARNSGVDRRELSV